MKSKWISKLNVVLGFTAVAAMAGVATETPAHALTIGALGGITSTSPSLSPNPTNLSFSSSTGSAYGLLLGGSLLPAFSWELNGLYAQFKYSQGGTATSFSGWQIPLIIRLTALPVISAGVGIQYNTVSNVPAGSDSSGWSLPIVLGVSFPLAPLVHFMVDGRYIVGLSNWNTSSPPSLTINQVEVLGGLTLGF